MQRTIHNRNGVGTAAYVIQLQALEFARLPIDQALLIRVHRGSKRLRWQGGEWVIHAGEAALVAAGQAFDVTNLVPDQGAYESAWLAWDTDLLAEHAERFPKRQMAEGVHLLGRLEPAFNVAFDQAHAMLTADAPLPHAIARHRMTELLHWLDLHGAGLAPTRPAKSSSRVRQLLVAAPDRRWSAAEIAERLAMSEATLRRRLASEGQSLSDLLVDVRMSHALILLQSTDRPISQIALDTGYESASRFAVRFRQRFGFAPTAVRGHQRQAVGQG
jgi:AraC-like DNA-binding protein